MGQASHGAGQDPWPAAGRRPPHCMGHPRDHPLGRHPRGRSPTGLSRPRARDAAVTPREVAAAAAGAAGPGGELAANTPTSRHTPRALPPAPAPQRQDVPTSTAAFPSRMQERAVQQPGTYCKRHHLLLTWQFLCGPGPRGRLGTGTPQLLPGVLPGSTSSGSAAQPGAGAGHPGCGRRSGDGRLRRRRSGAAQPSRSTSPGPARPPCSHSSPSRDVAQGPWPQQGLGRR